MTEDEKRANYLAAQTRYNTSTKGAARYKRYEAKHPERAETRWEPSRNGLRRAEGND
jgi:hypothetical protein